MSLLWNSPHHIFQIMTYSSIAIFWKMLRTGRWAHRYTVHTLHHFVMSRLHYYYQHQCKDTLAVSGRGTCKIRLVWRNTCSWRSRRYLSPNKHHLLENSCLHWLGFCASVIQRTYIALDVLCLPFLVIFGRFPIFVCLLGTLGRARIVRENVNKGAREGECVSRSQKL